MEKPSHFSHLKRLQEDDLNSCWKEIFLKNRFSNQIFGDGHAKEEEGREERREEGRKEVALLRL